MENYDWRTASWGDPLSHILSLIGGVAGSAALILLCLLAFRNPAPVEAVRGQSEDCISLVIEAGDTSWHKLDLTGNRILSARVWIESPATICVMGVSPLAGVETVIFQESGASIDSFLVDACLESGGQSPLITIAARVPSNLETDAILIRNQ